MVLDHNQITAFLIGARDHEVGSHEWFLSPQRAIQRSCKCEKRRCEAGGYVLRPQLKDGIVKQMREEIDAFRKKYGIAAKKVCYKVRSGHIMLPILVQKFSLRGDWIDDTILEAARESFDYFYNGKRKCANHVARYVSDLVVQCIKLFKLALSNERRCDFHQIVA